MLVIIGVPLGKLPYLLMHFAFDLEMENECVECERFNETVGNAPGATINSKYLIKLPLCHAYLAIKSLCVTPILQ